jgi:hypothetical protein
MKPLILAGALALAGCSSWSATPRASASARPETTPVGLPAVSTRPGVSSAAPSAGSVETKTICRSAGLPRGFATIDYTRSSDCTPGSDSTSFNARVVTDLTKRAVGSVVVVCRDQTIPSDWTISNPDPDTRQCTGTGRLAKDGKPAMEITKIR